MEVVGQIWNFLRDRAKDKQTPIGLYGSRRCSKTWTISQFLLTQAFDHGDVCIIASMTEMQGDAGAYEDCKNIIRDNPAWTPYFVIGQTPRRIVCRFFRNRRAGTLSFRSFKDADTAKGAACDWVYINEANKFTLAQYLAITANARKGVILDYNPENKPFWADELVKPENLLHCVWQWNKRHLTDVQLQWFAQLKERAERDTATAADKAFYRRYYLGEYAEISGEIFTPANIRRESVNVSGLTNWFIYADPSSMCGADYFAMVLCAARDGIMYIVDVWSRNVGSRMDVAEQMQAWGVKYNVRDIFVEANGLTGKAYYEEQRSSLPLRPYNNSENKHGRILGNYEPICTKVVFNDDAPGMAEYLAQVYAYEGKNSQKSHDDNIDAVNSAYEIMHRRFRAV